MLESPGETTGGHSGHKLAHESHTTEVFKTIRMECESRRLEPSLVK